MTEALHGLLDTILDAAGEDKHGAIASDLINLAIRFDVNEADAFAALTAVEVEDAFVRAINNDGSIQVAFADPNGVYAERPVTIHSVTPNMAARLISQLALALRRSGEDG